MIDKRFVSRCRFVRDQPQRRSSWPNISVETSKSVLRLAFLTVQANAEQNAFFERDKWMQNASKLLRALAIYLACSVRLKNLKLHFKGR